MVEPNVTVRVTAGEEPISAKSEGDGDLQRSPKGTQLNDPSKFEEAKLTVEDAEDIGVADEEVIGVTDEENQLDPLLLDNSAKLYAPRLDQDTVPRVIADEYFAFSKSTQATMIAAKQAAVDDEATVTTPPPPSAAAAAVAADQQQQSGDEGMLGDRSTHENNLDESNMKLNKSPSFMERYFGCCMFKTRADAVSGAEGQQNN